MMYPRVADWPTPRSPASRGAGTGPADDRTRQAEDGGQRQRQRTHQQGHPDLGGSQPRRIALHRAGQTHAERLHRKLQRARVRHDVTGSGSHCLGCWRADYNDHRPQLGWKTLVRVRLHLHWRWICAMSGAPRQLPSVPSPNRGNPTARGTQN
jgi:hypothetical protein